MSWTRLREKRDPESQDNIDASGNDMYFAEPTQSSQGFGDFRSNTGSIGIILDVDGMDHYTDPNYNDNLHWTKTTYGIGIDTEDTETGVN